MRQRYEIGRDPLTTANGVENPQTDLYPDLLAGPAVLDRGDESPLVISRYADIVFINQQKSVLGNGDSGPQIGGDQRLLPLDVDGEQHTRFRRLLDPLFAPKSKTSQIVGLDVEVRKLANALIDGFIDTGEVDLYKEFCTPLPTMIFVSMLGLPESDRPFFLQFVKDIVHADGASPEADAEGRQDAAMRMFVYLNEQYELRDANPDGYHGLLVGLAQAEVDGMKLTRQEQLNVTLLLMVAGLDTVTSALALMFNRLAQNPDEQDAVREDSSLAASAVEELLRWESPVQWGHRLATEDLLLPSGQEIKAGDHMQLIWAAGNLDEDGLDEAGSVKLDRKANRHLAFASGVHRCLGSHLARLELRCALEEFHARVSEYRIKPGESVRFAGGHVRTVDYLPMILKAR